MAIKRTGTLDVFEFEDGTTAHELDPNKKVKRSGTVDVAEYDDGRVDYLDSPVAPKEASVSDIVAALPRGAAHGVVRGLPEMAGKATEFAGSFLPEGIARPVQDFGKAVSESSLVSGRLSPAELAQEEADAQARLERGGAENLLYNIGEMVGPSVIPGGAFTGAARAVKGVSALAKAGKAAQATKAAKQALNIGAGGAAALFGLSQAQQTRDAALERAKELEATGDTAGATQMREKAYGWQPFGTGAIEAAGEFFGTKYLGKLLGADKAERLAKLGIGDDWWKGLLRTAGVEVGTEVGQQVGEAGIEKYSGIRPNADLLEEAKSVILPTLGLTALTGGAGAVTGSLARRLEKQRDAKNLAGKDLSLNEQASRDFIPKTDVPGSMIADNDLLDASAAYKTHLESKPEESLSDAERHALASLSVAPAGNAEFIRTTLPWFDEEVRKATGEPGTAAQSEKALDLENQVRRAEGRPQVDAIPADKAPMPTDRGVELTGGPNPTIQPTAPTRPGAPAVEPVSSEGAVPLTPPAVRPPITRKDGINLLSRERIAPDEKAGPELVGPVMDRAAVNQGVIPGLTMPPVAPPVAPEEAIALRRPVAAAPVAEEAVAPVEQVPVVAKNETGEAIQQETRPEKGAVPTTPSVSISIKDAADSSPDALASRGVLHPQDTTVLESARVAISAAGKVLGLGDVKVLPKRGSTFTGGMWHAKENAMSIQFRPKSGKKWGKAHREDLIKDTVAHELAHAVSGDSHGPEFKAAYDKARVLIDSNWPGGAAAVEKYGSKMTAPEKVMRTLGIQEGAMSNEQVAKRAADPANPNQKWWANAAKARGLTVQEEALPVALPAPEVPAEKLAPKAPQRTVKGDLLDKAGREDEQAQADLIPKESVRPSILDEAPTPKIGVDTSFNFGANVKEPAPKPTNPIAAHQKKINEEFPPGDTLAPTERTLHSKGGVIVDRPAKDKHPRGGVVIRLGSGKEKHLTLKEARNWKVFNESDFRLIEKEQSQKERKQNGEGVFVLGLVKKHGGFDPRMAGMRSDFFQDLKIPPGILKKGGQSVDKLAAELGYDDFYDMLADIQAELEDGKPHYNGKMKFQSRGEKNAPVREDAERNVADASRQSDTGSTSVREGFIPRHSLAVIALKSSLKANPRLSREAQAKIDGIKPAHPPVSRKAEAEISSMMAKLVGKSQNVFFVDSNGLFNGVKAVGNNIFVDANATNPLFKVFAHEMLHADKDSHQKAILDTIWNTVDRKKFKEWRTNRDEQQSRAGLPKLSEADAIEEFSADFLAEEMADPEFWERLAKNRRGTFERMISWIREKLKALGVETEQFGYYFSRPGSLAEAVRAAEDFVRARMENVPGVTKQDLAFMVRAFHGGPHRIEGPKDWKLDKAGTGEGAAAYGYGAYFSSLKDVAEQYRRNLSPSHTWTIKPEEISPEMEDLGFTRKALDMAKKTLSDQSGDGLESVYLLDQMFLQKGSRVAKEAASVIRSFHRRLQPGGYLYHAELDVDDADLLDWDKPLSEQSEKVRAALEVAGKALTRPEKEVFSYEQNPSPQKRPDKAGRGWYGKRWTVLENVKGELQEENSFDTEAEASVYVRHKNTYASRVTGETFYNALVDAEVGAGALEHRRGSGKQAASRYLASIGIPGIRYLDQGSRYRVGGTPIVKKDGDVWHAKVKFERGNEQTALSANRSFPTEEAARKWADDKVNTLGTYNYVLFDDKLITLTHRNDEPMVNPKLAAAVEEALGRHNLPPLETTSREEARKAKEAGDVRFSPRDQDAEKKYGKRHVERRPYELAAAKDVLGNDLADLWIKSSDAEAALKQSEGFPANKAASTRAARRLYAEWGKREKFSAGDAAQKTAAKSQRIIAETERRENEAYAKSSSADRGAARGGDNLGTVKDPWEMSGEEFAAAVARGKLHKATGKAVPGERDAKNPLRMGELNGYSSDDIAHFYAYRRGYGSIPETAAYSPLKTGREELIIDALDEGKAIPPDVLADFPAISSLTPVMGYEKHKEMFKAVAEAQRGAPEEAMRRTQRYMGGGLLEYAIEHIGDLTHRMSGVAYVERDGGYDYIYKKVSVVLRDLTQGYGFAKEVKENAQSNAGMKGISFDEYTKRVDELLAKYKEEHLKIPVFNEAQRVARDAAVALADRNYNLAAADLMNLKEVLDQGVDAWAKYALDTSELNNDIRFSPRDDSPPAMSEMLMHSDYEGKVSANYFKDGTLSANSREVPQVPQGLKIGMWRYDDWGSGNYGHGMAQLRLLNPHDISLTEDVDQNGRRRDADRYAKWFKEGKAAPPIEVLETDKGTLTVTDGHRRVASAKTNGVPVLAWVSPSMDVLPGKDGKLSRYNGDPAKPIIKTGLTYEAWKDGTAKRTEPLVGEFSDVGIERPEDFPMFSPRAQPPYSKDWSAIASRIQAADMAEQTARWAVDKSGKWDNFQRKLNDRHIDMLRLEQTLKAAFGELDDRINFRQKETLGITKADKKQKDYALDHTLPILNAIKENGETLASVGEYMKMKHVLEYNKVIRERNPGLDTPGSGISDEEATAFLEAISDERSERLENISDMVRAAIFKIEEMRVEYGLETQSLTDHLRELYPNWISMQREEAEDKEGSGTGKGYNIRGSEFKVAHGSPLEVNNEHVLSNIFDIANKTILRGENNRIGQATYGAAVKYQNSDYWLAVRPENVSKRKIARLLAEKEALQEEIDALEQGDMLEEEGAGRDAKLEAKMAKVDKAIDIWHANRDKFIGQMREIGIPDEEVEALVDSVADEPKSRYLNSQGQTAWRVNTALRDRPYVFSTRFNGEDHFIFFNKKNDRALAMAAAMKNEDVETLGGILAASAWYTRVFSQLSTQWNIFFGPVNATRDIQEAMLNLTNTPLAGKQWDVAKKVPRAVAAIYRDLRARSGGAVPGSTGGDYIKAFEEMSDHGGPTGMVRMLRTSAEKAKSLEAEFKQISEGKLKSAGRAMFDWISDYNEALENGTRLAVYMTARDSGLSAEKSAVLAKEITINFNRKGQISSQAGALYAFFNAAVQGSATMGRTLLNGPKGKQIVIGGMLLGSIQALALAAAGYEDDEPPDFVKQRNLIIPWGDKGKHYSMIPFPLGFAILPSIGRMVTEQIMNGGRGAGKLFSKTLGLMMDTFLPVGGGGNPSGVAKGIAGTVAFTPIRPILNLAMNEDYTGRPISQEDYSFRERTPGFMRSRESASALGQVVAKMINAATGGTKDTPKGWSPTADDFDFLVSQYAGGVGREAMKIASTTTSLSKGETPPSYKMPLVGRFYGTESGTAAVRNRFYGNLRLAYEHKNEIEGKQKRGEDFRAYIAKHPEAPAWKMANAFEAKIKKLKDAKEAAVAQNKPAIVKTLDQQVIEAMGEYNKRFDFLRGKK